MRGYSPKLILGKQVHPLFRDNIDAVRSAPDFYKAAAYQSRWVVQQHSNSANPYYAKYMGDVANVLMESSAIYFHLQMKLDGTGFGATLGKLQLVAFVHGYASPRRVTMYVKRLVQDGRLAYLTDGQDRRIRRLIPCEPLIRTARQNIAGIVHATAMIWPQELSPEQGVIWPREGDGPWGAEEEAFFERLFLATGKIYLSGADPLRPFSDIRHFTSKDAGSFLLASLITGAMNDAGIPSPTIEFPLNYSEVAALTGVSRTHVRNVIEGAQQRGLIAGLEEGGRSMQVTEKLIDSFERHFASLLILTRNAALDATGRCTKSN